MAHSTSDTHRHKRYKQRIIRKDVKYTTIPTGIAIALLALEAWEIARENVSDSTRSTLPWSITVLGVDTTATVVVALFGLVLAREQFARAVRPILGYTILPGTSQLIEKPNLVCRVFNGGPGTATVLRMEYQITPGGIDRTEDHWTSGEAARAQLEELGLTHNVDFFLTQLGEGCPFPPDTLHSEGWELLAFKRQLLDLIEDLEVRIQFVDTVGDRHERILGIKQNTPSA